VQLRQIVARARPPIELCRPDLSSTEPTLGTIHASKGREADTVVLVMPPVRKGDESGRDGIESALMFEEGRVYYVGATRARNMLYAAGCTATPVGYLDSKRVYRSLGDSRKIQLEIGREGDVDQVAHLAWSNRLEVQRVLASSVGRGGSVQARAAPEDDYALRLILEQRGADGVTRYVEVGQLSASFRHDLGKVWSRVDAEHNLKPSEIIRHLYLVGVTTVGVSEEQRAAVKPPFNQSGLGLAAVVKGFPLIQFLYRGGRRNYR
jgi:hypothetical protein